MLNSYLNIILEQTNKYNNNFANNGMRYIFEEIFVKYILINNSIVEDMRGIMRELEIANDESKSKLI